MAEARELVLVADDDEDIVRFVEVNLRLEGYEVHTVSDGEQALEAAYELTPDLILLDVMMPKLDGFEVCQRLRSDSRTKHISVIMLTAKSLSADKVVGLTAGADDYMIKPFDPIELIARVKSALRRSREMRGVNPLTQLPGNIQVQEQVTKRVAEGRPFALMYIDLDNFKAFNDHYGFLEGDEVIKLLAACAGESMNAFAGTGAFLGHIGGDDFVAIVDLDSAEHTAHRPDPAVGRVDPVPLRPRTTSSAATSRSSTGRGASTASRSPACPSASPRTRTVRSAATGRPRRSPPR